MKTAVIQTQEEYNFVFQQLQLIQDALELLRQEVEPKNKRNFEILSEGYEVQIEDLMRELDTYKGPKVHRSSAVGAGQSPISVGNFEIPATAAK